MKSLFISSGAVALIVALTACTQKEDAEADAASEETTVSFADTAENLTEDAAQTAEGLSTIAVEMINEDTAKADGSERFYGKETFTIVSKQTGLEEGDVIEHVREWGRLRAEIKNTTMTVAGFSQETKQRSIFEGEQIATVDEISGAVTLATNPLYDSVVARMKGKSGVDFGKEMMIQMGGVETDDKGSFAGYECRYWEIASLGSRTCVTDWGGALHSVTNLGGMSFEKTATDIRMNDGGPDEAFFYDAANATEAPNLQDIMKQMQQPG